MSDATTTPPAVPGLVLGQVIGRGATSTVWSAVRVDSGSAVAVKVTAPERLHVGQLMELAARETAILANIDHEHLVRLHEAHPLPDGSVAVVLDLARGGSLADLVAARGRLDGGEVSTICTPLAGALAALHAAGVVHGDVSPGNVLFTAEGKPVLSDFEAARLVGEGHPPLVAGTSGFVAPEVVAGDLPGEAADVFSLGALAWFALTGRSWSDRSWANQVGGSAPPGADPVGAAEASAVLGPRLGPVVAAMLAEDPANRPSAQEAAVLAYQAAAPVPVRLVGPAATDPDRVLTQRLRGRVGRSEPGAPGVGLEPRATGTVAPRARIGLVTALAIGAAALAVGVVPRLSPAAAAEGPARQLGLAGATPTAAANTAGLGEATTAAAPATIAETAPAAAPAAAPETAPTTSMRSVTGTTAAAVVLDDLIARRAAALTSRAVAALGTVDAPASKQLDADVAIIADLERADQRFVGLTFTVTSAEWVAMDSGSARIRAVVERSGFHVRGPGEQDLFRPVDPGRSLVYWLVRVEGEWRLADVTT